MDQALIDMLDATGKQREAAIRILDPGSEEIETKTPTGPTRYTLKPLRDLYGQGRAGPSVSPRDPHYEPLFMAIEEQIAAYDRTHPKLTDALVQLTLERMNMDPAAECGQDDLCRWIQVQLRLVLSLNDYSRRELKTALGTIARSVARHKSVAGRRGYLEFIHEFFG